MSMYIGIMSGTSVDAIDVVIIKIDNDTTCQLIATSSSPIPAEIKREIQSIITSQQCELNQLGQLDTAFAEIVADAINDLLAQQYLSASDIDAIGHHGQTLFHAPTVTYPFSMQIGNASLIAEKTGIATVSDFRQRDIAVGGQGAPLVPAFHQALFSDSEQQRVIVNIGGISNITLLPATHSNDPVLGFDTGPGNTLIDFWIQQHLNTSYDDSGQWGASGTINQGLLDSMLGHAFFSQAIPKSTGREHFNPHWLDTHIKQQSDEIAAEDIQATLVELTAKTICLHIDEYASENASIYICGGGAHNHYLMQRLAELVAPLQVATTNEIGLDPDWVEACAFAWLAYRTINHRSGNISSVTGAKHPAILGGIYPT